MTSVRFVAVVDFKCEAKQYWDHVSRFDLTTRRREPNFYCYLVNMVRLAPLINDKKQMMKERVMTLPEAAVKILSTLGVALLGYLLKNMFKFQCFTSFRRLSNADKSRLFSLLHKSNDGFLNNYKIQSQMLMYGIRYSAQFMKNFFTMHIKTISAPTIKNSQHFYPCLAFLSVKIMVKLVCRKARGYLVFSYLLLAPL